MMDLVTWVLIELGKAGTHSYKYRVHYGFVDYFMQAIKLLETESVQGRS